MGVVNHYFNVTKIADTELVWLIDYSLDSIQWGYFIQLKFRINDYICLPNKFVNLVNLFKIDNSKLPFGVNTGDAICNNILVLFLRYNLWNQYYYDNMDTTELYQLIDYNLKKYQMKKKLNDVSEDFN